MTVSLPSCVRRSPYRLVCASLPTVVYIKFDQRCSVCIVCGGLPTVLCMTVSLPSCVRRSPCRLGCAGLPTVLYILFDQHVVAICASVVSLHLHHWPLVCDSSSLVAFSSRRVVDSGSHTMHATRTFYISSCPCVDEGCSRGVKKPKFILRNRCRSQVVLASASPAVTFSL